MKGFKFLVKMEKQCVKALQLTLFHLLKIQNGAYSITSKQDILSIHIPYMLFLSQVNVFFL